jgi:hypothetical protein
MEEEMMKFVITNKQGGRKNNNELIFIVEQVVLDFRISNSIDLFTFTSSYQYRIWSFKIGL